MVQFWLRSPLMSPDDGGGGGTGGSGAGAGGQTSGVDMAGIAKTITDEVNKAVNGVAKSLKTDQAKAFEGLTASLKELLGQHSGQHSGQQSQDGGQQQQQQQQQQGSGTPDKPDPRVKGLEKQLADLQKAVEQERSTRLEEARRRQNAERDSQVQRILAGYAFTDSTAAAEAASIVTGSLRWTEGGDLVGPEDVPAKDFVKAAIDSRPYLLAPRETGGAGAGNGDRGSGRRRYTLDDLDPEKFAKLKPEEQAEARRQVGAAVLAGQQGR
jgi:hypothetical protein